MEGGSPRKTLERERAREIRDDVRLHSAIMALHLSPATLAAAFKLSSGTGGR